MKTINLNYLVLVLSLIIACSCTGPVVAENPPVDPSADLSKSVGMVVSRGEKGCFQTINEAIQASPLNASSPQVIFIKNGVYNERVIVDRPNICLIGESRKGTRIEYAISSIGEYTEQFHGKEIRRSTIMIQEGANNCTLTRLTVYNNYGSTAAVPTNEHQFAVFGRATRTTIVNCNIWSDGSDDLALWGSGMYYHADCDVSSPGVDFLCPRGWCYAIRCRFYGNGPAIIWHDGSKAEGMKLVIRDSFFGAAKNCVLGRYHHDCQFYLLNCYLSNQIADSKIGYAYEGKGESLNENWGARIYYHNVTRGGKTSDWMKNNMSEAKGSPKPDEITAGWTFGGQWDPEAEFKALGEVAAYEKQNIFDPIQKPAAHHSFLK